VNLKTGITGATHLFGNSTVKLAGQLAMHAPYKV